MKKLVISLILASLAVGCGTTGSSNNHGLKVKAAKDQMSDVSYKIIYGEDGYPAEVLITASNTESFEFPDETKLKVRGFLNKTAFEEFTYKSDSLFTGREVQAGLKDFLQDTSEQAAPVFDSAGNLLGYIIRAAAGVPTP